MLRLAYNIHLKRITSAPRATWEHKVVSFLRYCGRAGRTAAIAVFDPKETNSASACCNALTPLVHASDRRAPSNFGADKARLAEARRDRLGFWACRSGYLARRYTVSLLSPVAEVATNFKWRLLAEIGRAPCACDKPLNCSSAPAG
jgi:hypothetical protein